MSSVVAFVLRKKTVEYRVIIGLLCIKGFKFSLLCLFDANLYQKYSDTRKFENKSVDISNVQPRPNLFPCTNNDLGTTFN